MALLVMVLDEKNLVMFLKKKDNLYHSCLGQTCIHYSADTNVKKLQELYIQLKYQIRFSDFQEIQDIFSSICHFFGCCLLV